MSLPPLSSMRKQQLIDELIETQAEGWTDKMTVIELRTILKDVRKVCHPEIEKMKGLASKKLPELQDKYRTITGQEPEAKATKGQLMLGIRKHVQQEAEQRSKPDIKMNSTPSAATSSTNTSAMQKTVRFGKYVGMNYEVMMKDKKDYCVWVLQTYKVEKESADPGLVHFAEHLIMKKFTATTQDDKKDAEWEQEL